MTTAELDNPKAPARPKVVLVDDDPAVLLSLRRLLRREPYELLSTVHPERALAWIEEGDVSLMLVDQRMPELCGTELAGRVRRCSPGTIRVMLTAFPGNTVVQHGLARDVQWLISKPWNDHALRLTIRQLLQGRESSPPSAGPEGGSWLPGGAVRRILRAAAHGLGWILGFFGTTDAGGMFPR
jgi:response regulator RpfG family c-di-GMP phosphodiesterase